MLHHTPGSPVNHPGWSRNKPRPLHSIQKTTPAGQPRAGSLDPSWFCDSCESPCAQPSGAAHVSVLIGSHTSPSILIGSQTRSHKIEPPDLWRAALSMLGRGCLVRYDIRTACFSFIHLPVTLQCMMGVIQLFTANILHSAPIQTSGIKEVRISYKLQTKVDRSASLCLFGAPRPPLFNATEKRQRLS
ncbi:hypothetical protein SRHO_G00284160 [Serrasalmus rhombeus]